MPRPKPPSKLKARWVRMSDEEFAKFQALGGAAWLRRTVSSCQSDIDPNKDAASRARGSNGEITTPATSWRAGYLPRGWIE